jgi:hypothetical protein
MTGEFNILYLLVPVEICGGMCEGGVIKRMYLVLSYSLCIPMLQFVELHPHAMPPVHMLCESLLKSFVIKR